MTPKTTEQNAMVRIGGLWLNKSQSGVSYMSGTFGTAKLLVFRNTRKEEGSSAPDYNLYIAEKREDKSTSPSSDTGPTGDTIPF